MNEKLVRKLQRGEGYEELGYPLLGYMDPITGERRSEAFPGGQPVYGFPTKRATPQQVDDDDQDPKHRVECGD